MTFRKRRAVLRALRDPEVRALMEAARQESPEVAEFYDDEGFNVKIPTGVQKIRWLFGADLSERKP